MKYIVYETPEQASRAAANLLEEVVAGTPKPLLGLATGGTVVELYRCLVQDCAAGKVNFSATRTVNLDEYIGLPHSHPQSFAYFMHQNLFSKANFQPENLFLVDGSGSIQEEINAFNAHLQANTIDIQLLGIGNNGHIGFNEPAPTFTCAAHTVALTDETIQANSRFFNNPQEVPRSAITMGVRDIVKARKVVLLAFGAGKAEPIRRLFADDEVDPMLPCSIIKLAADAVVIVDKALADAAGLA